MFVCVADAMKFKLSSIFGDRGTFKPCTPATRTSPVEVYRVSRTIITNFLIRIISDRVDLHGEECGFVERKSRPPATET
jgi:hypothetical protein